MVIMNKILFSLLFCNTLFSQQIVISEIDEFTKLETLQINASKEKKWKTSDNITKGFFNYIFLSLKKVGSIKMIQLDIQTGSLICINNNDDKIILLLEDDDTIELQQVSKLDCSQRVVVKYFISDEQIKILSKNNIKKFRIYTYDGYINLEVKEDKKQLIQSTFSLFTNNI